MEFPANPTLGQQFTFGARTWQWTGASWALVGGGGGGGGGAPGGDDKAIQFNASGVFAGDPAFTYDAVQQQVTAPKLTTTGIQVTPAASAAGAGFRIPHGAAPSSPVNGDLWTTTAGLFVRIAGATVGPLGTGGGGGGGSLGFAPITTFTPSQSSVFSTTTPATNANMTDGDGSTGTGTNNAANPEWIEVDWGTDKLIAGIQFGGGNVPVFGAIVAYLNGRIVEYWTGSAWAYWFQIPGGTYTDSGLQQFFVFVPPTLWRTTSKLRLRSNGADYVATTEFVPYEVTIS